MGELPLPTRIAIAVAGRNAEVGAILPGWQQRVGEVSRTVAGVIG